MNDTILPRVPGDLGLHSLLTYELAQCVFDPVLRLPFQITYRVQLQKKILHCLFYGGASNLTRNVIVRSKLHLMLMKLQ